MDLRKAVAEGKISAEAARARLQGMRKAMADRTKRGGDDDREFDMEAFVRRIKAAVERGDMTREEAGKMIDGARRRIKMRQRHDDGHPDARGRTRSEVDRDGIRRRIEGAVARGEMTREQAAGRIAAYKKSARRGRQAEGEDKEIDYDAIAKRIRAAVRAGKLTKEEAKAKWAWIMKAAGARKGDAKDKNDD